MRVAIGSVLLVAALAGCSGKGGDSSTAAASASQAEPPANLTIDPDKSEVPVTMPSPQPLAAIPAAFQGRWGTVGLDCNPAKADIAKGLMTISGNRLSFYEARGTAAHIRQDGAGRIDIDLPMSGEGQTWSEPTILTVLDGGRVLVRQATGSPDRAGTFTYQRCPG